MSEAQVIAAVETVATTATPPKTKRFSFGPVWNKAVLEGKDDFLSKHTEKLVEQAIKLKIGVRSDLKKLKLATLRSKVAAKLQAEQPVEQLATTVSESAAGAAEA